MTLEAIVLSLVLMTVCGILFSRRRRMSSAGGIISALVAGLVIPGLFVGMAVGNRNSLRTQPPPDDRPIEVRNDFVSSQACASCHPHEHATWHASYHRTMTQEVSRKNALGSFDNVELQYMGRNYLLTHGENDSLWALMDDPESTGPPSTRLRTRAELVLCTGSHHMQVYWYSAGKDRMLAMLPFSYVRAEEKWFPRHSVFLQPPLTRSEAAKRELSEPGRWNHTCIRCHTTNPMPGCYWDGESPEYQIDSHVGEFGIACEACHGPGISHVRVNRNPGRRFSLHLSEESDDTIVNPRKLDHVRASQVCGQCHSRYVGIDEQERDKSKTRGSSYRPGDDLAKTRKMISVDSWDDPDLAGLLESEDELRSTYWPDGMMRIGGREYNGLVASPCYLRGELSCISCHAMHQSSDDNRPPAVWADDQLGVGMRGNDACLQCHQAEFPDAQSLESHTHHSAGSHGSVCYNCHMPHTSYALLKAIRSHQITSPSVDESVLYGRPNACNLCHLDKTLEWTGERLVEWYEIEPPVLPSDEAQIAASVLWVLKGNAAQRALMAWAFGWPAARSASGSDWTTPWVVNLLQDDYDAIRIIAARSLRTLPQSTDLDVNPVSRDSALKAACRDVLSRWKRKEPNAAALPSLLINAGRGMDVRTIDRLLQERDNRPVTIFE